VYAVFSLNKSPGVCSFPETGQSHNTGTVSWSSLAGMSHRLSIAQSQPPEHHTQKYTSMLSIGTAISNGYELWVRLCSWSSLAGMPDVAYIPAAHWFRAQRTLCTNGM